MKRMRVVKFIYFLEGAAFITIAALLSLRGGFPVIAASSVICTALFSFTFGLRQTKAEFGLSWREVLAGWLTPAARLGIILTVLALALWAGTRGLSPSAALTLRLALLGGSGAWIFWRWGLSRELQHEIVSRVPRPLQEVLRFGTGHAAV